MTRADLHYFFLKKNLKYIYDLYFKAFACSKEAMEMMEEVRFGSRSGVVEGVGRSH